MSRHKHNRKKHAFAVLALAIVGLLALLVWYLHDANIAVLNPKGPVAAKERSLLIFTALLSLVVIIPVFTMTIVIAWKYREGNTKAVYKPDWDRHRLAEFTWWAIPIVIISILGVVTWTSTYALAPYKSLASTNKPINIEVVALDWKWLFIYPQQNIATVNWAQIPVNTPINFEITSDTVMNSFWVPQLGGQIYAMPGMKTQLNLLASQAGSFNGSSANISGTGFAGMTFTVKASSNTAFNGWVHSVKRVSKPLNQTTYKQLAKPSEYNQVSYYSSAASNLYDTIILSYMVPPSSGQSSSTSNGAQTQSTPSMEGMYMR
jgi:cytochrome o ubiquinol oxidase subunit II